MFRIAAAVVLAGAVSQAAVVRFDVSSRAPYEGGRSFANVGPYEVVAGKAHFALDPRNAANRIIADIDLAARQSAGKPQFSADYYVLRPRNARNGNGTGLFEIANRGHKLLFGTFDTPDPFLLEHGFTLVWIGWEFDVPTSPALLKLYAPVLTDKGTPITGIVRSEWIGNERVNTISLGDRDQIGYPVANPNDSANTLYVRGNREDKRAVIPRMKWRFLADGRHVVLDGGFAPGKIYEVVYRARDPVVTGFGPAAVRDAVAAFKYGGAGLFDRSIQRAIGFGISQSGRFLRTFLYEGFNADEQGRRVFDGVWAHVAGAGRGSFNFRFAQPSRDGNEFFNIDYPVDIPPFDTDALLARARAAHAVPKLFLTNGSYEYWGRCASLIHTTEDGRADQAQPPEGRIYFIAGAQHGAGSLPPAKTPTQNPADTLDQRPVLRALLLDFNAWVANGTEPPPSVYPRIDKRQLVRLSAYAFPHIANVMPPRRKREAFRFDFSKEPPTAGEPYPTLVPQVDEDGNELGGIRMPAVAVPLATYTGWNLRAPSIGAPGELLSFIGSWLPFPRNATERDNMRDPRVPISARYAHKRDYLERVTAAAQQLVKERFLMEGDVPALRERSAREWDYIQSLSALPNAR